MFVVPNDDQSIDALMTEVKNLDPNAAFFEAKLIGNRC